VSQTHAVRIGTVSVKTTTLLTPSPFPNANARMQYVAALSVALASLVYLSHHPPRAPTSQPLAKGDIESQHAVSSSRETRRRSWVLLLALFLLSWSVEYSESLVRLQAEVEMLKLSPPLDCGSNAPTSHDIGWMHWSVVTIYNTRDRDCKDWIAKTNRSIPNPFLVLVEMVCRVIPLIVDSMGLAIQHLIQPHSLWMQVFLLLLCAGLGFLTVYTWCLMPRVIKFDARAVMEDSV
jgi:hypothetical protein